MDDVINLNLPRVSISGMQIPGALVSREVWFRSVAENHGRTQKPTACFWSGATSHGTSTSIVNTGLSRSFPNPTDGPTRHRASAQQQHWPECRDTRVELVTRRKRAYSEILICSMADLPLACPLFQTVLTESVLVFGAAGPRQVRRSAARLRA